MQACVVLGVRSKFYWEGDGRGDGRGEGNSEKMFEVGWCGEGH